MVHFTIEQHQQAQFVYRMLCIVRLMYIKEEAIDLAHPAPLWSRIFSLLPLLGLQS